MKTSSVMIVEDDARVRSMIRRMIADLVRSVYECAGGEEAVKLYRRIRPDLVLMDVYLEEGCDGTKAAKWLNDACDIPVLFVTGHSDRDTLGRIRRVLPQAQLFSKPVAANGLAEAISHATGWTMPSIASH